MRASVSSRRRRAASIRIASTAFAGVRPRFFEYMRAKLRGLICARAASDSMLKFRKIVRFRFSLSSEERAVLRLPTRALQVDNEHTCNANGSFAAAVFFYKGQGEIDPGR